MNDPMSHVPNPFADSDDRLPLRPVGAGQSEQNPYASPNSPVEHVPVAVALYRDAQYVVAHPQSTFPPICLRSNHPASETAIECRLRWSYPIDLYTRTVVFRVPICRECLLRYRKMRKIGWWMILIPLAILVGFARFQIPFRLPDRLSAICFIALVATMIVGLCLVRTQAVRLSVKRVWKEYFWLRGAPLAYLDRLPPWLGS